jgi:hypothetical protein
MSVDGEWSGDLKSAGIKKDTRKLDSPIRFGSARQSNNKER